MNNRLQAKDLINVGIFTAILFVICMGVAMVEMCIRDRIRSQWVMEKPKMFLPTGPFMF